MASSSPHKRKLDERGSEASINFTPLGSRVSSNTSGNKASMRRSTQRRLNKQRVGVNEVEELARTFRHIRVNKIDYSARKVNMQAKFAEMDPLFEEYLMTEPAGLPEGYDPRKHCFCLPCDRAQMDHLRYFDRPPRVLNEAFRAHYERAKGIVRTILCDGRKYDFPDLTDLIDVPFKPNKFGGFEYAREGLKTRKEANTMAQADAEAAWVKLMHGERVVPHMVRLGGRGKVVKSPIEQAKLENLAKGRLILMLSQRDLKILGVTEKILTDHCKRADNPIFVGKSWFFRGAQKFISECAPFSKFYCFDAEKFDSNIDPYMVDDAIVMLRELFHNGQETEYDAYWAFVRESLLSPTIVRDDGVTFEKEVGTTSGHSHNSLVQSLITLMIGYTCLIALNPNLDDAGIFAYSLVKSLGDDNLIGICTPMHHVSCEQMADVAREAFGINWFGSKSFATSAAYDVDDGSALPKEGGPFEGLQFLGKYFCLREVEGDEEAIQAVIPYRPITETLDRLAYPERPGVPKACPDLTEGNMSYMRAVGNYMDGAGNKLTRVFLEGYLTWLEGKGHHEGIRWREDDLQKMTGIYDGVAETFLPARRYTYEEWLDLVLVEKKVVQRVFGSMEQLYTGV
ncbi:putative RNA-dependent RNA polymerase [Sclerotium hydrophilum virus 1]|uniref:Putative RNA-dependent RNA polymerase n=1 Tax=Sclerotium hydrophilum virus 1 TaxID=1895000 RepID=A0A1B3SH34_9VIRU|nr:putative RNA-dependent RNA polymerase [Sclerotium hydrophilum virus 1]AOG59236.1 putative RNA-dependent RNA polymerase [Sclerotium hydrophilum virus 1]